MGAVYFSIDLYLIHMLRRVLPLELFFETGRKSGGSRPNRT